MPEYKESQVTGIKYVECSGFKGVLVPRNKPTIEFFERVKRELDDGSTVIKTYGRGLKTDLVPLDTPIELRNPNNDALLPVGYVLPKTYTGFHILLYSMYRQLAALRDAEGGTIPEYDQHPFNTVGI